MNRRLVILWDYYQHYHLARLRSLQAHAAAHGWEVTGLGAGLAGAARDSHAITTATDAGEPVYLGEAQDDLDSWRVVHRLQSALEKLQPAAVIFPGYGFRASRTSLQWCRRRRRGAVMIVESQERDAPRTWFKEWFKRRLMLAADAVFCGGISHERYATRLGMSPDRIFPGYSVVDNEFWRTTAAAGRSRPPLIAPPYFLAVGRFVPKKNFVGLVAAFAQFKRSEHNGWRLVIVGDGPEKSSIAAEITRQGLVDWIHLPGYANAEDTAGWLAHAGAFVMSSDRAEQWGLVVNEAMAAEVPVVVSDVCGCVEDLVQDGVTGLVFSPSQPDALPRALQAIATDAALRRRLAARGHERVLEYSLDRFARQALAAAEKSVAFAAARPA